MISDGKSNEKAYHFLEEHGLASDEAEQVKQYIRTYKYRKPLFCMGIKYKLEKLYSGFDTKKAMEIAKERRIL